MWSKLGSGTKRIVYAILAAGALVFAVQFFEICWYYGYQGEKTREKTLAFSMDWGESDRGKVLIVGDSTGAGTGAESPRKTIAGFLVDDGYSVKNLSKWGAMTSGVLKQLESERGNHYDKVLIFTGGNDIIWFYDLDKTFLNLKEILEKAKEMADEVIVVPPGNVGLAPMFKEPIGLLYERRTRTVREKFIAEAEKEGAIYVDLFTESLDELFSGDPLKYFSPDLLHPSSEGYLVWYEKIKEKI